MTPSLPSPRFVGVWETRSKAWDSDKHSSTIGTCHAMGHPAICKPPSVFDTTATLFDTCERIPILTLSGARKGLNLCQSLSINPKRPVRQGIVDLSG